MGCVGALSVASSPLNGPDHQPHEPRPPPTWTYKMDPNRRACPPPLESPRPRRQPPVESPAAAQHLLPTMAAILRSARRALSSMEGALSAVHRPLHAGRPGPPTAALLPLFVISFCSDGFYLRLLVLCTFVDETYLILTLLHAWFGFAYRLTRWSLQLFKMRQAKETCD